MAILRPSYKYTLERQAWLEIVITLSSLIQSLLNHIKTTVFHIKNESGSWLASLCLRDSWPIPSVNIRNQAMMLSKFFLYWCDASAHFCWAPYFMGKIILLTIPRWKKSLAAMPLIISSSGGQWLCKQTYNIRRKVWWQSTWNTSCLIPHLLQPNHGKNIQCTTEGDQHSESLHFNLQCSASCNSALVLQKYRHKSHDNLQKR